MRHVLGIETSCDETAVAVVAADGSILANLVLSQLDEHRPYGGVVPEIAARAHVEHLDGLLGRAVETAGLPLGRLDAIAATAGPGLIGGLMVGLVTAKALALALDRPLIAVNHLEAHALSVRLTHGLPFPYLLLLLSGGHCQFQIVEGVGRYRRLGTTIDDAVGEAFDKVAKLLGLGYPGGPALERAAAAGDVRAVPLPRPMLGRPGCDFSFAGLKTAAARAATAEPAPNAVDLAAGFQAAVADILADRAKNAIKLAHVRLPDLKHLVLAGGVAANQTVRRRLDATARECGLELVVPPAALCTDNAAMVAWAGLERLALGLVDPLDVPARARWPLDPKAAPAPFAGGQGVSLAGPHRRPHNWRQA